MAVAIVDFEGFQLKPHSFVIKELAYYSVKDGFHACWTFKPPHSWRLLTTNQRMSYAWLTRHHHRLCWESGDLPYGNIRDILAFLFSTFSRIYVKGAEKAMFLENMTGCRVFDLEDLHCPKRTRLPKHAFTCPHHVPDYNHCALAKAIAFGKYLINL